MTNYDHLLELHELAVREARRMHEHRPLFEVLRREEGRHLTGIVGPRGAGKTVLLKQLAASEKDSLYISVDAFDEGVDLFETIKNFSERYRFHRFLLDEVHFLRGAMGDLKKIHDFLPDVRVFLRDQSHWLFMTPCMILHAGLEFTRWNTFPFGNS
jgi:predicted AAA+ superfamily ATPase